MASTVAVAPAGGPPALAGAADGAAAAAGGGGGFSGALTNMLRIFLLYQFVRYMITPATTPPPTTRTTADGRTVTVPGTSLRPAWADRTRFDLHVYVNDDAEWDASTLFSLPPTSALPYLSTHLLWHEADLSFEAETWESPAIRSLNLTLTEPFISLAHQNQSLYAHIYFSKHSYPHASTLSCDSTAQYEGRVSGCSRPYQPLAAFHFTQQLNAHRPPPKVDKRKSLLSFNTTTTPAPEPVEEVATGVEAPAEVLWRYYWKPTLHIRLVHDHSAYTSLAVLPPEVKDQFHVNETTSQYYPLVYCDYFWLLPSAYLQVNDTVSALPLLLTYSPISFFKYRTEMSMEASWKLQQSMGTHSEADTESIKRILIEGNPYLLAVTAVVSLLHMVFDFLAFKNDVAFWRQTKNTAGLSGRAVLLNLACQVVVFLYLLDNDTAWMILTSSGIGLLIEAWKVPKLFNVSLTGQFPFLHLSPKTVNVDEAGVGVTAQDRLVLLTQRYDREAMVYMSYVLYPLVLCYFVYSLVYNTHKSWYSFILTSLVGSVYTFGFINVSNTAHITARSVSPVYVDPVTDTFLPLSCLCCQMCPQLYLNWRLKSVAAMPWRQMTYKALNTVIDDLFTWIVPTPTLYRVAAFRDDIIFLVFLYQRWIYRTDANRTNEFGLSGADMEEIEKRKREKERGQTEGAGPRAVVDEEERKEAAAPALITAGETEGETVRPVAAEPMGEVRQRRVQPSAVAAATT